MCSVCGCDRGTVHVNGVALALHGHANHDHNHVHAHTHEHGHSQAAHTGAQFASLRGDASSRPNLMLIEQDILAKNSSYAVENRKRLTAAGVLALNMISGPGSGKTTLLVKTIEALRQTIPVVVIEGDQETANDADRIRATGAPAVQINTGRGCHLDAHMVGHALDDVPLARGSILFIENVGNLVCPATFDLGEARKVAILSVTEGDDKPLKYPDTFAAASMMILSKSDLLPHVDFNVGRCIEHARSINPHIAVLTLSARTNEGMSDWLAWLKKSAGCADIQTVADASSHA
jgi:hydrogenase nickel incorporation protein HypB